MKTERHEGPTPNGGAYSEITYFNDAGQIVDSSESTRCAIRELDANGSLINEIWGTTRGAECRKRKKVPKRHPKP